MGVADSAEEEGLDPVGQSQEDCVEEHEKGVGKVDLVLQGLDEDVLEEVDER